MRQLLQSLNDGSIEIVDVAPPRARGGFVHVRNVASIVSPGTERMIMELAQKNLAEKARARPDLVRKVLDKVQRDGPMAAYRAVTSKLGEPIPVGYACAGEVVAVGPDAEDFTPGTLVACAGAGYASHAEEVAIPKNLVVKIPDGVTAEQGAFATIGAIALQGVRITKPELGETVAVVGLGLLGLLTVQILRASGCRVLGTDPDPSRVARAIALGADAAWELGREDLTDRFLDASQGHGVDAVIVTASADSNAPMVLAGNIARDRGRVTVVGAVKTDFDRNVYYMKELEVRLSRSYGPGRYDPRYEERGEPYPRSYVRFTETENLRTFLDLVARGSVKLDSLITHRFPFADALQAYETLLDKTASALGIVLTYSHSTSYHQSASPRASATNGKPRVSFIGAGAFARSVLLPALTGKAQLARVATARGHSAHAAQERFGFETVALDSKEIFEDERTDVIFVTTRHDTHADLVTRALAAKKHVFCEKPLAIDHEGLDQVARAMEGTTQLVHVGFNRRFAPMSEALRKVRADADGPATFLLRVNAGALPPGHWASDAREGGSRMVGEGCHFVDLARYVVGSRITHVACVGAGTAALENFTATLSFADGSVATIVYTSTGDTRLPKERFELFAGGAAAVLDDFSNLTVLRGGKKTTKRTLVKDKGHAAQLDALMRAVERGTAAPIPPSEILEVSRATIAMADAARTGERIAISPNFEAISRAPTNGATEAAHAE